MARLFDKLIHHPLLIRPLVRLQVFKSPWVALTSTTNYVCVSTVELGLSRLAMVLDGAMVRGTGNLRRSRDRHLLSLRPHLRRRSHPSFLAGVVVDFARACREHHVLYHQLTLVVPLDYHSLQFAGYSNPAKPQPKPNRKTNPYVDIAITP